MSPNPRGWHRTALPGYSFSPQQVLFSLLLSLSADLLVKSLHLDVLGNQGWDPWEWAGSAPRLPFTLTFVLILHFLPD